MAPLPQPQTAGHYTMLGDRGQHVAYALTNGGVRLARQTDSLLMLHAPMHPLAALVLFK
jgi:hypothetical protein